MDGLSQWATDSPVMMVNDRAPTDRLRLTLAHELGHVCLHSDQLGGDPEDEANAFAAEFLMHGDLIRSELRNLSPEEGAAIAGAAPGRDYASFLPRPRLSAV